MGFAFPKEERALVLAKPSAFQMPSPSDLRYNWVDVRLDAIDDIEMEETSSTPGDSRAKRVAIAHSATESGD